MSGSLQIKNGKYYAVISYKNEQGKRKQKWVNTNLEAKGNKRKAEDFLNKLLANDADFSEGKSDVMPPYKSNVLVLENERVDRICLLKSR